VGGESKKKYEKSQSSKKKEALFFLIKKLYRALRALFFQRLEQKTRDLAALRTQS